MEKPTSPSSIKHHRILHIILHLHQQHLHSGTREIITVRLYNPLLISTPKKQNFTESFSHIAPSCSFSPLLMSLSPSQSSFKDLYFNETRHQEVHQRILGSMCFRRGRLSISLTCVPFFLFSLLSLRYINDGSFRHFSEIPCWYGFPFDSY